MQSLSPEDIDLGPDLTSGSSGGANDHMNYTVLMPPTPDNQPFAASSSVSKPAGDDNILPPPFSTSTSTTKQRTGRRGGGDGEGGGRGGDQRMDSAGKLDRRMSVIKTNKSMLLRSQTGDFDHTRFLFEHNKGTYGIGNAYWPQDGGGYDDDGVSGMCMDDFLDKPWKPLTRKVKVPPGVLSPYR